MLNKTVRLTLRDDNINQAPLELKIFSNFFSMASLLIKVNKNLDPVPMGGYQIKDKLSRYDNTVTIGHWACGYSFRKVDLQHRVHAVSRIAPYPCPQHPAFT
jgi:hypothetical protein